VEAYHIVDEAGAAAVDRAMGEDGGDGGRPSRGAAMDDDVNRGPLPNVTSAAHEAAKRGNNDEVEEDDYGV